jgi:cysteine desulfurase
MGEIGISGQRMAALRDLLWNELSSKIPCLIRNGSHEQVLPNNLNVSIEGIDGAALFSRLKRVAVSNASACLNGVQDFSQVLTELGVDRSLAKATLRFGIGRFNTESEILVAAAEVSAVVNDLRRVEREFARIAGTNYLSGRCDP